MSHILMTGGSKGIGKEFALTCLAMGHRVVTLQRGILDYDSPRLQNVHLDLSDDYDIIRQVVAAAINLFEPKRVDWLVLAGGMGAYMGWQDYDPDKHEEIMRVNYFGPRWVFHAAARSMLRKYKDYPCKECEDVREETSRHIITGKAIYNYAGDYFCWKCGNEGFTRELCDPRGPSKVLWLGSSVTQPPGATALEDYAGSKGAVMGSLPSIARHYKDWGIRQFELATSWVDTPMTQAIKEQNPRLYHQLIKYTPLKRMATVEEAAETMYFMLSGPEYFHGCRVPLTGGANG